MGLVIRAGEKSRTRGGFDLNAQDIDGNTPLHHARYKRATDIAIKLISFGADPFLRNKEGKTQKDVQYEMRDLIVEAGVSEGGERLYKKE